MWADHNNKMAESQQNNEQCQKFFYYNKSEPKRPIQKQASQLNHNNGI